jgi:hypothetical protein
LSHADAWRYSSASRSSMPIRLVSIPAHSRARRTISVFRSSLPQNCAQPIRSLRRPLAVSIGFRFRIVRGSSISLQIARISVLLTTYPILSFFLLKASCSARRSSGLMVEVTVCALGSLLRSRIRGRGSSLWSVFERERPIRRVRCAARDCQCQEQSKGHAHRQNLHGAVDWGCARDALIRGETHLVKLTILWPMILTHASTSRTAERLSGRARRHRSSKTSPSPLRC